MNIELGNIKTAFKPDNAYMSDLAVRIQRKAGIEAKELFEEPELMEPILPRHPVQLSVEFGNSYVAEVAEETFIEAPDSEDVESTEDLLAVPTHKPTISDRLEPSSDELLVENTEKEVFNDEHFNEVQSVLVSDEANKKIDSSPVANEKNEVRDYASNSAEVAIDDTDALQESRPVTLPNDQTHSPVSSVEESTQLKNQVVPSEETDEVLFELPEVVISTEDLEAEKQRAAEIERKRAEAAARYAALLDESRADYVPISKAVETKSKGLPWGSILGIVASLAAIASAWWVWSLIQTPITVEQVVENTRDAAPSNPSLGAVEAKDNTVDVSSLPAESQLVLDLVWNSSKNRTSNSLPHFTELNERSKQSMVILENQSLLVMDMEDQLFDQSEL